MKDKSSKVNSFIDSIKDNEIRVEVGIKGRTPLLMHRFDENAQSVKNLTPREVAEGYAYRLDNGELYIPAECIYQAMINGGKFFKHGKNKVTCVKSTILTAGCWMDSSVCKLGTKDYEVDSRSVVNQNVGARIMCHRPRLDNWETSFIIRIDSKMFEEKFIFDIVCAAGRKIGVLAYRPERKGSFGTFDVVKWKVIK